MTINNLESLKKVVNQAVSHVQITDVHTHLYPGSFGDLLLWGIDELLTYHYLIAEFFRYSTMDPGDFYKLTKREQADRIWQTLFLERSPLSEAQRGVLTTLHKLGLDVASRDLNVYREYFADLTVDQYIDQVLDISHVRKLVMTNDPFDPAEREIWTKQGNDDQRFQAALRLDPLLNDFSNSWRQLAAWGYQVSPALDQEAKSEIRRFLTDWIKRMDPVYMAVSLPPTFQMPEDSYRAQIIEHCILPVSRELNIPLAMMIGVNKLVNYKLGLAGDALGKADIRTVEYLCRTYPKNKFLVTMLSRENQHELAIMARKFNNLLVFGCWWFLNNPSLVEEITYLRMETLGLSFIPQHSDARVLDQLIYKWEHSSRVISGVLVDKYSKLMQTGWQLTEQQISRDVAALFADNFEYFLGR